jgi:Methyltransferase domain
VDLVERNGDGARRHPWEAARAQFFLSLLRAHRLLERGADWLDVGAGDAWFAAQLRRLVPPASTLTCWDINYSADDLAAGNGSGLALVRERPATRFDCVLMLDVVEHVEDDADFVGSLVQDLLVERGVVLVAVPAYQALFSSHDRTLRHYRRYSPTQCRRLLERSGLTVRADGGLFHSLLLPRLAQTLYERVRPATRPSKGIGDWRRGERTTNVLTRALVAEGELSLSLSRRGVVLPGLSYWALCDYRPV